MVEWVFTGFSEKASFNDMVSVKMAQDIDGLTVVDVYDQAAAIGKEFEKLIEVYGTDSVTQLMPNVIQVLEQLEQLATKNEQENAELIDLRETVQRLQMERADRLTERDKYEQELEAIEDSWKKETKELLQSVAKLQEDNRRLKDVLEEHHDKQQRIKHTAEQEFELMSRMKDTVDKQRADVRALQRELQQKNMDVEGMAGQVERLVKTNTELRNKHMVTQRKAQNLISDKSDLEAQIQEREQQIAGIMQKMAAADDAAAQQGDAETEEGPKTPTSPRGECLLPYLLAAKSAEPEQDGKILIDMKDPNRPRFTLHELREVLLERNQLKAKLLEVEEELQRYRPAPREDAACGGDGPSDDEDDDDEEERPVQGPINREPDEKLFPRKTDSGIRKFFRGIFSSGKET